MAENDQCQLLEQKQRRCFAHYRVQCVKTKAAIIVLLLSAGVFCAACLLRSLLLVKILATSLPCPWCITLNFVLTFTAVIVYPVPGYLADVYYQRFGVMKCGLLLNWSGALATVVVTLLDSQHYVSASNLKPAYIILLTLITIGTSAFHANIVPFGLEQLQSSSSEEIVAFMHSYLWLEILGVGVAYVFSCAQVPVVYIALLCFALTTVVVVGMECSQHYMVIERTSKPLSLKYLLHALQQSTHQRISERISLTGQQLSDIKTALKILLILVLFGLTTFTNVAGIFVSDLLSYEFSPGGEPPQQVCYLKVASVIIPFLTVIPLYHFLLHPFLHRYIPSILNRVVAGLALYTLVGTCLFAMETAGHYSTKIHTPCFLSVSFPSAAPLTLSYHYLIIVHVINAVALFAVTSAIYEFISAKSPYSVKGLMVGLMYASSGMGRLAGFVLLLVFRYKYDSSISHSPCGLWYYAINIVFSVGSLCVFVLAVRSYERKQVASPSRGLDHWSYESTDL